jgi:hypothetical protein
MSAATSAPAGCCGACCGRDGIAVVRPPGVGLMKVRPVSTSANGSSGEEGLIALTTFFLAYFTGF